VAPAETGAMSQQGVNWNAAGARKTELQTEGEKSRDRTPGDKRMIKIKK
jgi:hypothetical protein